jgi:hypothetical protein
VTATLEHDPAREDPAERRRQPRSEFDDDQLAASNVLDKLAARVAPPSVKEHLAGREAERELREQAWRDEQAARLREQRTKLEGGESRSAASAASARSIPPPTPPRSTAVGSSTDDLEEAD